MQALSDLDYTAVVCTMYHKFLFDRTLFVSLDNMVEALSIHFFSSMSTAIESKIVEPRYAKSWTTTSL